MRFRCALATVVFISTTGEGFEESAGSVEVKEDVGSLWSHESRFFLSWERDKGRYLVNSYGNGERKNKLEK